VNFISRPVQKSGINKYNPIFYDSNTLFQIDSGSSFFIHDSNLDGIFIETQGRLHQTEQFCGGRRFFRPMHFRFYNINTTCTTIAISAVTIKVKHRCQYCNHCIEKSFRDFLAIASHGIRVHMGTNIAYKHHAATM